MTHFLEYSVHMYLVQDGCADQLSRRPGSADRDWIRRPGRRINCTISQKLKDISLFQVKVSEYICVHIMSNKSLDAYLLYKWPFPHSLTDRLTQPMLSSFLKRQDSEKTNLTEKVSQTLHSLWILFISQKLLLFFGRNSITFFKGDASFYSIFTETFLFVTRFLFWHRFFF